MGYNLLINRVYWGYNPLTNHLLICWDIQVEKDRKDIRNEDGYTLDLTPHWPYLGSWSS